MGVAVVWGQLGQTNKGQLGQCGNKDLQASAVWLRLSQAAAGLASWCWCAFAVVQVLPAWQLALAGPAGRNQEAEV